jgi:hypothetical protein
MLRVYRCGLPLGPTMNAKLVSDQIWLAHRYNNVLIEIERARRAVVREILLTAGDVAALGAAFVAASELEKRCAAAIKAKRATTRSRSETDAAKASLAQAKLVKKDAGAAVREARRRGRKDPEILAQIDDANDLAAKLVCGARALCGVYWGTYLMVEKARKASNKMPLYDKHGGPNDPAFVRWDGKTGAVGVQIQNGCDPTKLLGDSSTLLQIVPRHEEHRRGGTPDSKRSIAAANMLRLRVGSDGRAPVWAEWPIILHRPLPKGSLVKEAKVIRRVRAGREEWSAMITVTFDAESRPGVAPTGGKVGIDLGWRVMPPPTESSPRPHQEGIRVASWLGDDGACGDLVLSPRDLSALSKADSLRAIRDRSFDLARAKLLNARDAGVLPPWLNEEVKTLGLWKSPNRLARLTTRWKLQRREAGLREFAVARRRHESDESVDARVQEVMRDSDPTQAAFVELEAWRYHDEHIMRWESDQRTGALRHRREVYRIFAARLTRRYSTIVLEGNFDLSEIAKRPEVDEDAENETARTNRHAVAVSELRLSIVNTARAVWKADAAYTTLRCFECKHVETPATFDTAVELVHTCTSCGAIWDQDHNARANILELGVPPPQEPVSEDTETTTPAANARWTKMRRLKEEKALRRANRNKPADVGKESAAE